MDGRFRLLSPSTNGVNDYIDSGDQDYKRVKSTVVDFLMTVSVESLFLL